MHPNITKLLKLQTVLHANLPLVQASYEPIKNGIMKSLNDIKESGGKPKLNHFTDWANATSQYWLATTMSPTPFHPLNMAASTGTAGIPAPITHIINNGGAVAPLKAGLLTAFTHVASPVPFGIPFATKLVTAFTAHLVTVGGLQTEFVTSGSPQPQYQSDQYHNLGLEWCKKKVFNIYI